MIVKLLGGIDLVASLLFLSLIFNIQPPPQLMVFASILLFVKGLFVFSGDVLSVIDLFSAVLLALSIAFSVPQILLWLSAFFLLSKAVVSFM
ncbi:hypothetical protein D6817_03700 [Candidatus Pacearchaeota archaeon]|nr:MAG: hypothetical protein D6817_03700 [Candidatus Pacearchaeota archaeon]